MQNGVKFSEKEGTLTARLSGEIDHHAAKMQRSGIDGMLFQTKPNLLILDFSEVKFMDSSGIGLIIGRASVCESMGCLVNVIGLSKTLKKLVKLSGVEKIKGITVV